MVHGVCNLLLNSSGKKKLFFFFNYISTLLYVFDYFKIKTEINKRENLFGSEEKRPGKPGIEERV